MRKTKLTIALINWNTMEMTEDCITSIYESGIDFSFQIILVDNDSVDKDYSKILKRYTDIKLIKNDKNYGFAYPCNQCWKASNSEYFLLLNNDTLVKKNAIKRLVEFLDNNKDYAGVTGKLLNSDGSIQMYMHRRFPTLTRIAFSMLYKRWNFLKLPPVKNYLYLNQDFNADFDIEQAAGTLLLLRSNVINELGYLFEDKLFPLYYNDVDLSYRLHKSGFKIRYIAKAEVVHLKGVSTKKLDFTKTLATYVPSMYYFFKTNKIYSSYIPLRFCLVIVKKLLSVCDRLKILKNANLISFYKNLDI